MERTSEERNDGDSAMKSNTVASFLSVSSVDIQNDSKI